MHCLYAPTSEMNASSLEIYAPTSDMYASSLVMYVLSLEMYASSLEVYMYVSSLAVYASSLEVYASSLELYASSLELYGLYWRRKPEYAYVIVGCPTIAIKCDTGDLIREERWKASALLTALTD